MKMIDVPLKFRIMEYVMEAGSVWTQDIVETIFAEYGMSTQYEKNMINYDVIELVSAGFLKEGESKIDESGVFRENALLTEYTITQYGKDTVAELRTKVRHYE